MHTITQLSFTLRHYPEVVLGLQDNFPLPQYSLGEMPYFPFIYEYKLEEQRVQKGEKLKYTASVDTAPQWHQHSFS